MGRTLRKGGSSPAEAWAQQVCKGEALRRRCVPFLVGLLLWKRWLLLLLWPQGPSVPEYPLHVRTLLHPGRHHLLHHDVQHRGQRDEGARKSAPSARPITGDG